MSMPFDFTAVHNTLAHPVLIPVWETTAERDYGEWNESAPVSRGFIRAIVLMLTTEDLQAYPEGEATGGGISLSTDTELYFSDLTKNPPEPRQSYVEYQGRRYRVMGTGSMMGNTNLHIYHALRRIE